MFRTHCIILLAATLSSPAIADDKTTTEVDCYKMTHTTDQANELTEQGSSTHQTVSTFNSDLFTRAVITELYVKKESSADASTASFNGKRICRNLSAKL